MKRRGADGRFTPTLQPTLCPVCEQVFAPRETGQVFCSRPCTYKGRRSHRGAANNRYNGGLSTLGDGRTVICCRDGSMVLYYRAVMEAELHRPLRPDEIVHHVNGDPTDDRIENLEVVTRAQHIEIHRDDLVKARRKGLLAPIEVAA